MVRVRKSLAGAFEILSASVYQQADIISAWRERRMVRLSDVHRPEDRSVLASVMGVKQDVGTRLLRSECCADSCLHERRATIAGWCRNYMIAEYYIAC